MLRCVAVCCSVLQCVVLCIFPHLADNFEFTHCNTLQHTATRLQHTGQKPSATHCNRLQRRGVGDSARGHGVASVMRSQHTATHCSTLQHSDVLCNTLQCTATQYNTPCTVICACCGNAHLTTLQLTASHCNSLQHTATHCNTLQLTASHCNILQHSAT